MSYFPKILALSLLSVNNVLTNDDFREIFNHPESKNLKLFEVDFPSLEQLEIIMNHSENLT